VLGRYIMMFNPRGGGYGTYTWRHLPASTDTPLPPIRETDVPCHHPLLSLVGPLVSFLDASSPRKAHGRRARSSLAS
jgi:hypothetical protein